MDEKEYKKFNKVIDIYFPKLISLGLNSTLLKVEFRSNPPENVNLEFATNFISRKFNSLIQANTGNYEKLQNIYLEFEWFIRKYQKHKDYIYIRKLFHDAQLKRELHSDLYRGVEIRATIIANHKNACERCKLDHGKIYRIEEAIKLELLPHDNCTCKNGCACFFGIRAKLNNDGGLIFKD